MTIKQVIQKAVNELKLLQNPYLESEILLSHILKKSREFILTYPEYEISEAQIKTYNKIISRRKKGEPVAYLIGHKEFYGLNFFVNKNTLIPRPETELMVDEIFCTAKNKQNITLLDIGTGSGCIIITLAQKIKNTAINFFAIDFSSKALTVAKKNAKLNKQIKKIKFKKGSLLNPVIKNKVLKNSDFLFIAANLPYLTFEQIKNSPSIKFEPRLALFGGIDGLELYKKLLQQINLIKKNNPKLKIYTFLEIDPMQKNGILDLIKKNLVKPKIKIKKDLAGLYRLVIVEIN